MGLNRVVRPAGHQSRATLHQVLSKGRRRWNDPFRLGVAGVCLGISMVLLWPEFGRPNDARGIGLGASDIVIDPKNPDQIYISSTFYGVYKSSDSGLTWSLKNRGVGAPDFYLVAVHPEKTSTLFVGAAGGGIYRSDDEAESWEPANHGLTDTSVYDIVFDLRVPSTLYAVTLRQLFVSTDEGRSWKPAFRKNPWVLDGTYHRHLLVLPSKNQVFFLATRARGYKRGHRDQSWKPLGPGLKEKRFTTFAYDRSSHTVYAGGIFLDGLYTSTDGGERWEPIGPDLKTVWVNRIAIHPTDPSVIYLATKNKGALKSVDGGLTWRSMNEGLSEIEIKGIAIHPEKPDHLVIATYGRGIFTTGDGGEHWTHQPVPQYPTWVELGKSLTRRIEAKSPPPPPPAAFQKCQTCHAWTDPVLNGPAIQTFWRTFPSRRDWTETMNRMKEPARLLPGEDLQILKYLNRYYGPE